MMDAHESAKRDARGWRDAQILDLDPILAAALEAFNDRGFHGTSVRDLAQRVGATVPALYYHYANKEDILYSLIRTSMTSLLWRCHAAYDEAASVEDRFFHLVEATVRYIAECGKAAFLDHEMRALTQEHRDSYVQMRDEVEGLYVDAIEAGISANRFAVSDVRTTVRALTGMIQTVPYWYRLDGELSIDELSARYVDIAAHVVGAKPSILRRVRSPAILSS